jgi:hypothetical protein
MRQRIPCRRVVTIDSATRFWMRTGRPAFRASATVIGSIFVYDFEPNVGDRHLEQRRDLGPHEERVLAGGPERDLLTLDLGDDRVRLHRVLVDGGEGVLALHHVLGVGEDRLGLAAVDPVAVADVAIGGLQLAQAVEQTGAEGAVV